MAGATLLATILLNNKRFRAQLAGTAKGAGAEFKRNAGFAIAAVATLTLGLARAREKFVAVQKAGALASASFGRDITNVSKLLAAKGLGKEAEDVAAAFDKLAQNGVESAEEAAALLPEYNALARALGMDLAPTVGLVGEALRSMGIPVQEVAKHSDAFALVARQTTVDVADFASAVANNATQMRAMGLDIEDAAAAIFALESRGVVGSQAIETLSTAIKDGSEFQELYTERLGVSAATLAQLSTRIGQTNTETQVYNASVEATIDVIERATLAFGQVLGPAIGGAVSNLSLAEIATFNYATAVGRLIDSLSDAGNLEMPEVPQAFDGWTTAMVEGYEKVEAAARRAREEQERTWRATPAAQNPVPMTPPPMNPLGSWLPRPPPAPPEGALSGMIPALVASGMLSTATPATPIAAAAYGSGIYGGKVSGGTIPMFASGGIVDRATLGVVGEAGPEAIMPLDAMPGILADALMSLGGDAGGGTRSVDAYGGAAGGGGGVTIVIQHAEFRDARELYELARSRGL